MLGGAWKVLAAVTGAATLAIAPAAAAPAVSYSTLERDLLAQINTLRKSNGLAPLRLSRQLSAAADQHSTEMARLGYFAHESANGAKFDKRVVRYYPSKRFRYWSVGENLLWSSPDLSAPQALQLWLNSPPHRANLLTSRWRQIGISAVHVDGAPGTFGGLPVTIVTADFGVRR